MSYFHEEIERAGRLTTRYVMKSFLSVEFFFRIVYLESNFSSIDEAVANFVFELLTYLEGAETVIGALLGMRETV